MHLEAWHWTENDEETSTMQNIDLLTISNSAAGTLEVLLLFPVQPSTLPNHEKCPQPHDSLQFWEGMSSCTLLIIPADHSTLEALQQRWLSSVCSIKASKPYQFKGWPAGPAATGPLASCTQVSKEVRWSHSKWRSSSTSNSRWTKFVRNNSLIVCPLSPVQLPSMWGN